MDLDLLLEHLKEMLSEKIRLREGKVAEFAESLREVDRSPNVRQLYHDCYWDGFTDCLDIVLTFDGDLRGFEALVAFANKVPAEET